MREDAKRNWPAVNQRVQGSRPSALTMKSRHLATQCCRGTFSARRHARQAACGSGWAEEGRRYRRAQRLRPTALVEAGGMVERGRLEALRECMMSGVTVPPWWSRFIWRAGKYGTSQLHLFKHAPGRSAIPPIADVSLRRSEPPLRANSSLSRCGKPTDHFAV
jgi:hypothetical protein